MYCLSDPSLNTEKYGYPDSFHDHVRPLSCPIKSLSLIIPLEARENDQAKENLDFEENQHWREDKRVFENKDEVTNFNEVPLKNSSSNENVKKIIYYQTCSQASFEYPYFHSKDSFQSDASAMLMFCSSPEEVNIDYKEPKNGFNIWMNNEHKDEKEHQKKPWGKCCTNDWFEHGQHFAFQHPCDGFADYNHKDVNMEKNTEHNNPHFIPEQMFARFNANVFTACDDKPVSFGKEIKNDFFNCFNKEQNHFEKPHEKEKNPNFAPFFSPFVLPRRVSRSSHNMDHTAHLMPFSFLHTPQNFCDEFFYGQHCKQPSNKKSKKRCCSLNPKIKNMTKKIPEKIHFGKKTYKEKESWAVKYRKLKEKENCRKTGLCYKCREKMSRRGMSAQKRRPSIRVKKRSPLFVPGQAYKNVECNVSKIFAKVFNDKEASAHKQKNTHENKGVKTSYGKFDTQIDEADLNDKGIKNKKILDEIKTSFLNNKADKSYYISNLCPTCDNLHNDLTMSFTHNFTPKFSHDYCIRNDSIGKKSSLLSANFLKFHFKNNKAFKDPLNMKPIYNIKNPFECQGDDMMVFEDPSVNEMMKNYGNENPCKCCCNTPLEKYYNQKPFKYVPKKATPKKRLNSKLPLLRELSKIERETRNLEKQLKMALLKNESLEESFKEEIDRNENDGSSAVLGPQESDKTIKNLQYDFSLSKHKKKDGFKSKKRLYNKLVKSRTRAESVLKKVSRNMGKVEKIVNNFGGKGNFLKTAVETPGKKTPVVTPRNQFNNTEHPKRYIIQKPNLRAVLSKNDEVNVNYYQNFQHNNHYESENEKESYHHFFDNSLLSRDLQFNPHPNATNFCNHSHHVHYPNASINCIFNYSDCPPMNKYPCQWHLPPYNNQCWGNAFNQPYHYHKNKFPIGNLFFKNLQKEMCRNKKECHTGKKNNQTLSDYFENRWTELFAGSHINSDNNV